MSSGIPPGRLGLAGALAVIALVGVLLGSSLEGIRYASAADEGAYLAYAEAIQWRGLAGFGDLYQVYVADPEWWVYPNPLRVGYIAAAGVWTAWRGVDYRALSELSLLAHLLCIGVVYGFARRAFGDPRALFSAALVGFSPLGLGLARRALMDSSATLATLLPIWAFWEALRRPESRRLRLLFSAAFAIAILVKETGVLLLLPFAAILAFERARDRRLPLGPFAVALLAPLAVCAGVWLLAAGEPARLLRVVEIILSSPASNRYANLVGGGPWYRYVLDFLLLSPWPTLLALGACVALALRARLGELASDRIYLALLLVGLLAGFSAFTMNVRYVAVLDLPIRALAVCVLWDLLRVRRPAWTAALCGGVVALLCWADYRSFEAIFLKASVYDPISLALLAVRGIVPTQ